jgi:AcrR family transcriptional regulator
MGITERREREREEVQARILDAARDLFVAEGFERVTMRRIADAIEYSPTAIYHHFEDKDDLFRCLCRREFARLLYVLEKPLPADPIERIRALGLVYARFALDNPNHYRFMFMTPFKPERMPEPDDPANQSFGVLRAAVEEAVASGAFQPGDVDTISEVIWASVHGAIALLITMRPDCWPRPPVNDLIEQTIDAGVRAFTTQPSPRAQ